MTRKNPTPLVNTASLLQYWSSSLELEELPDDDDDSETEESGSLDELKSIPLDEEKTGGPLLPSESELSSSFELDEP